MLVVVALMSATSATAEPAGTGQVTYISIYEGGGTGSPNRQSSIFNDGRVSIDGQQCQGCRWHAPFRHEFTASPQLFNEVARLLTKPVMEKASESPCTMQRAGDGRVVQSVTISDDRGPHPFTFVKTCLSPELQIARDRMAAADTLIRNAAEVARRAK